MLLEYLEVLKETLGESMAIFWMHKEKKISGASVHLQEIILPPGNLKMSEWENKFCIAIDSSFLLKRN